VTGLAADSLTQSVACAINRAAGGRPIPGNRLELLIDGPDTYAAMLDLIDRASRWIHFENYIIRSDTEGRRFAEALATRAREGLPVRVLYDAVGSMFTSRKFWRLLRGAGVEVRAFHPLRPLNIVTNFARDHRKLVVADGAGAVMGGLCIGREWTGGADSTRPWRDTAVRLGGPAAAVLDQAFARTWATAGRALPDEEQAGRVTPEGDGEVRVIVGEPGRERAFRVIELLAAGCMERLWITDAYMLAPPRLFQALRDAARDGVDVRLLVPGSSDLPLIRNLSRIGYRELLRSGVRIYEWDGPMLHAKTIVVDGRWVRIGSSNLNPSSLIGNYELDVLVEDRSLAEAMERQFRLDIGRSREVRRRLLRIPRRISEALPTALTRNDPDVDPGRHRRTRGETRRRAALALRALVSNARRSVFIPLAGLFVVLGLLFFALPRQTAYVFGAICAWLAISAGREAFRRRADR
jgi:cardiolipin synthase A/B